MHVCTCGCVCVLQGCIGSACWIVRGGSCVRGLRCEDGLRGGGVECFVLRGFGARGFGFIVEG